jgi:hypothetical protein
LWLNLRITSDLAVQLWQNKDCQAGKKVTEMMTDDLWRQKFENSREYIVYRKQSWT